MCQPQTPAAGLALQPLAGHVYRTAKMLEAGIKPVYAGPKCSRPECGVLAKLP